jgi:NADH-quinone oxidoreductase subunit L
MTSPGCSLAVATIGFRTRYLDVCSQAQPGARHARASRMPKLHKAALNRFYIDDAWQFFTHKIVFGCFSIPIAWFDRHVIDGMFNFSAWATQEAGETIRPWQSGDVRQYAVLVPYRQCGIDADSAMYTIIETSLD